MTELFLALVVVFALVIVFLAFLAYLSSSKQTHDKRHAQRHVHEQKLRMCLQDPLQLRIPDSALQLQACRACGVYRKIIISMHELNILQNTINRFETELERIERENIPEDKQIQFLRDERACFVRRRHNKYDQLNKLYESL